MYHLNKLLLCIFALSLMQFACAHTYLSSVTINGAKQTQCIRTQTTNANFPITDITSKDMMCGFLPRGAQAAASKCSVAAGSVVGLQWNHESTAAGDMIIDDSHKGPCLAYLSSDNGATWFKIYENGYDNSAKQFCVTTLKDKYKGYMTVTIPSDIAAGNYLLRGELIALHEGYKEGGAQPYVYCAELTITGGGSAKGGPTVTFPGAYTTKDPGLLINIYNDFGTYTIPGPAVYKVGSTSATGGSGGAAGGSGGAAGGSGGAAGGSGSSNPSGGDADQQQGGTSAGSSSSSGGGLSPGGSAAIAIVFIALFAGAIAFVVYKHKKHGHVFGYTLSKRNNASSSAGMTERKNGAYAAYDDRA